MDNMDQGTGGLFEFSVSDVIAWALAPFGTLFRTFLNIAFGFLSIDLDVA